MPGWVFVRVPATSANLGPGFDSLGLALSLYDQIEAQFTKSAGLVVEVSGQGADEVPTDARNLVVSSIRAGLAALDPSGELAGRGLHVRCQNRVPHGRGMGSSASAIVGGIRTAAALAGADGEVGPAELVAVATRIEGHPDNVAAAVLGGATIAWMNSTEVGPVGRAVRVDIHPSIVPVLVIPKQTAGTSKARAALPATVAHADAAFNVARSALLVHALSRDPSLLLEGTADRLHQNQRRAVYPQSLALVEALRAQAVPAAISGAGPTVVAFAVDGSGRELAQRIRDLAVTGEVLATPVSDTGAHQV